LLGEGRVSSEQKYTALNWYCLGLNTQGRVNSEQKYTALKW